MNFTLFRLIFGTYLIVHLLTLFPYAPDLFSQEGLIQDPTLNPLSLPSIINSRTSAYVTVGLGVLCSLAFTLNAHRRPAALLLAVILHLLFLRNNLTSNPSLPYLNLLLVLSAFLPKNPTREQCEDPVRVAAFLLALGYTFSGLTKLSSPSWLDGSAFYHVLNNPLARTNLAQELALLTPEAFLQIFTWGALTAELLFLPLWIWKGSRPWIWLTLVSMHLGLIFVVDFADLSLGMIMVHLFIFDPRWIPSRKAKNGLPIQVSFDADCLMCNGFIRFLSQQDFQNSLRFHPLPSDSPKDTLLALRDGQASQKSGAVMTALETLGGEWRVLAIGLHLSPRALNDAVYVLIAKNRHRLSSLFRNFRSGKAGTHSCSLPPAKLQRQLAPAWLTLPLLRPSPPSLWWVLTALAAVLFLTPGQGA